MYIDIKPLIFLIVFVLFSGCGSMRKLNNQKVSALKNTRSTEKLKKLSAQEINLKRKSNTDRAKDYILKFAPVAQEEMKRYKIPASITLAQGILESGNGNGRLALKANNHFGIKCHKGWKGKKIYYDDDKKGECFRVYKNANNSYRDHSIFLSERSRYDFLFDYKTSNYKAWAKGLKKAGYATDPKYPKKIIELIERYELYRYDKHKYFENNENSKELSFHEVKKGDTIYSISKKYNISIKELVKVNDLKNNTIYLGQKLSINTQN